MSSELIKRCPKCEEWLTVDDLSGRAPFEPIGMLVEGTGGETCLFFYNHQTPDCRTTLTVEAWHFAHLMDQPIPEQSLFDTEECPGSCTRVDDLKACPYTCASSPYRTLFLWIRARYERSAKEGAVR